MKTITLLMDSLNRHLLSPWGGPIQTPNMERLFQRGAIADHHYAASLPCMPARRDMMTGRASLLENCWGPMEPWDESCIDQLRLNGVYTHMITDHYHYFHAKGENYQTMFNSWEFERGQESDVWKGVVEDHSPETVMGRGKHNHAYWSNRSQLDLEDDLSYPTPRCFLKAVDFLKANSGDAPWHLHLEVFDPHEPFDCPKHWLEKTDDQRHKKYLYNWPSYAKVGTDGEDDEDRLHIRHRYAATLMMADHYLGKMLDEMDAQNLWEDTCLILTTDHGHLLGEHGYWAKNYMQDYEEITHIPLVICHPSIKTQQRLSQLTWSPDLAPTLLDLHDCPPLKHAQGKSWIPLLGHPEANNHETVITGYFSKDISITDGQNTYIRQTTQGAPCYIYTLNGRFIPKKEMNQAEFGDFLPYTDQYKVLKIEKQCHRHHDAPDHHILYDLKADPQQEHPIYDEQQQAPWLEKLSQKLIELEAPTWHWDRLDMSELKPKTNIG